METVTKHKSCNTCQRAIFDAIWGEFKCMKEQHIMYTLPEDCENYLAVEKGKKVPISAEAKTYMETVYEDYD